METERKFLLSSFPTGLPVKEECVVYQYFLSVEPYVRIREKQKNGRSSYKLTIKGDGTLSREEVEFDLDKDKFERLKKLCDKPPVEKIFKAYSLPDGKTLECSLVDKDFYYAEVEFESETDAEKFVPTFDFLKETTYDKNFKMNEYWKVTRLCGGKFQT